MNVVTSPTQMQQLSTALRDNHKSIAFVPTMGCLHDGHLSLIQKAKTLGDVTVVSIFVNPLQFGPTEDFDRYPRPLEIDLKKCQNLGVDYVFCPDAKEFYRDGFQTTVFGGPLSKLYCGQSRPGFFDGVLTVVSALFNLVRPTTAIFGEKDFQQLHLVRGLTADLWMGIEIVGAPIIREPDGLAFSSRNIYLSPELRQQALSLSKAVFATAQFAHEGERDAPKLIHLAKSFIEKEPAATVDYVEIVDAKTLKRVDNKLASESRLLLAAYFGQNPRVRLIDNGPIF